MAYKKRITISLSDKVLESLEKLAKDKGLSKSAMVTLALDEYSRKESEQKNKRKLAFLEGYEFPLSIVLIR